MRANSELRVGIIGCGHISAAHLKAWGHVPNARFTGVFDLKRELADARAQEFGVPIAASVQALLDASDVVDICTPPKTHSALAQQAIEAGKHLVVEKPVVTAQSEWEVMRAALEDSPSQIAVIHNIKVSAGVQTAKRWVEQGRIGEILRIQREFLTSAKDDRMLEGEGHWSHGLPGGRWFETLPHELYLTHYFAGELPIANVTILRTERALVGTPADEVLITLAGGHCLATIHFSAHCEQNRRVFTLQGTRGRIVVDILGDYAALSTSKDSATGRALGGGVAMDAGRAMLGWATDRAGYLQRRMAKETPHGRIITMFANYLRGNGEHPTPLDEVDYVIRGCELIGREIDRQIQSLKPNANSENGAD